MMPQRMRALAAIALFGGSPAAASASASVNVYAAGSLRALVTSLSASAAGIGVTIEPVFGGSGALRDRIEKGESADLLLSADLGSPDALTKEGRTQFSPIAFARNRLCLVARRSLGLNATNLLVRLTAAGVRIKTSKPVTDPAGDYAMAMFDLMDRAKPGVGPILRAKAASLWNVAPKAMQPGQNPTAALFGAQSIDVAVTYCSASADIVNTSAELDTVPVPDSYDPRPVYGMAVLTSNPAAARLALLLLSEQGQALVTSSGLIPVAINAPR